MEFSPSGGGLQIGSATIASNLPGPQSFDVTGNGLNVTATTTSLTALPNPANVGDTVTLSASVAPMPTGSPLGSINFLDGSISLGMINIDTNGNAMLPDLLSDGRVALDHCCV